MVTDDHANDTSRTRAVEDVLCELRPAMRADGGNVELMYIDGEVVHVRLCGTCTDCPSAHLTMTLGIERTLRTRLPWVRAVEREM
ncbi:MAG: NifU family protein [Acidobacteriota bacterium]|nr:NifU family protein [Acidobacteriota bacterium]